MSANVWSATSYLMLRREALEAERRNLLHPDEERRVPYVASLLGNTEGPIVAVSDYMRAVPDQIARWVPGRYMSLGTDGFGRSDSREALRKHFEINAEVVAFTVLSQLASQGKFPKSSLAAALRDLGLDPDKPDPATA